MSDTALLARVEELEYVLEQIMVETEPHLTRDTYTIEDVDGNPVGVCESLAKALDQAAEVLYRDSDNDEE